MTTIALKCRCGEVQGSASNITPSSGNRVVCCCSDCQAFASHLGANADTLDEFGGTEIFQITQSQVSIQRGHDKLQAMRLTKKGLLRWYASCCNTPIGNTMNASMPFVGLVHTFVDEPNRDDVLGPIRAVVQTQHAIGVPSYPKHSAKFPLGVIAKIVGKMLIWKLQGKHKPSVFFGDDGRPTVKPIIADEKVAV
ncbi:MAG: DUF6151 family protein [Granulosicoccaceae bacterium]